MFDPSTHHAAIDQLASAFAADAADAPDQVERFESFAATLHDVVNSTDHALNVVPQEA